MHTAMKVFRYEVRNAVRGKAVLGYTAFLALATWALVAFGGGPQRALPSLVSLVLLVAPLVSLLVTVVALYEGSDFTELLLSHPVTRTSLLLGRSLGLAAPLAGAFLVGVGLPLLAVGLPADLRGAAALLLLVGTLLTATFVALGVLVAVRVADPARGLGAALLVWLALTLVYDGVVLALAQGFAAYPLERPMLAAMLLNPVDLARVAMMLAVDASVLAGYTGAVFADFFGGPRGPLVVLAGLGAWVAAPWALALRRFRRMDL